MRRFLLGFLIIGSLVLLGIIVYLYVTNGFTEEMIKPAIALAGTIVAITRMAAPQNTSAINREYLKIYDCIIGDAFRYNPKAQRKMLKAIAFYNRDKYKSAIKAFLSLEDHCVSENERFVVSFFIALCYDDLQIYDIAKAKYKEAISHNENSDTAWSNLGLIHKLLGEYDDAITCLEKAIAIEKKNQQAYSNIASLYLSLLEYEKAIKYAQSAIEIVPNMYQALEILALAYAGKNDKETAEKYYQKSIINGCSDPEILREMIDGLYKGHHSVLNKSNND